jgi:hypothetical protein
VVELITRANAQIAVGCFEYDWDEGDIIYRHGSDWRTAARTVENARMCLDLLDFPVSLLRAAADETNGWSRKPRTALDLAMIRLGATDIGRLAPESRRLMLTIC